VLYPIVPVAGAEGREPVAHVGRFNRPEADKAPVIVSPVEVKAAILDPFDCSEISPDESPDVTIPPAPVVIAFIVDAIVFS
jgi:hypothetical protein